MLGVSEDQAEAGERITVFVAARGRPAGSVAGRGGDHGGGLAEPAFREGDDVDEVVGSDGGVLRLHALHLQHECSQ